MIIFQINTVLDKTRVKDAVGTRQDVSSKQPEQASKCEMMKACDPPATNPIFGDFELSATSTELIDFPELVQINLSIHQPLFRSTFVKMALF